jgi:aspartyl-tRNA(Asn)/glutamyl-tRNA(Gln) amidotransferase subunit A
MPSFARLGAKQLAELVRRRDVSAREAVSAALAVISSRDDAVNAFVTLCADRALASADEQDARLGLGEPIGPLVGVPVAIKDLLSTEGTRTTFGSVHYVDNIPAEDDVAVARLRAAGAIIVGKTNTSEFGYGAIPHNRLFPATRNPWNLALGPGGSSAGSAAAVAAGMVPLALGSDGGGSIRVPAALTGLVGFKPSWGRIPVYPGCRDERMPGASGWESLEHIGPLTRSVEDAQLAYSVLVGPDPRDRHSLPFAQAQDAASTRPVRICYSPDLGFAAVDPEVAAICEQAVARLDQALDAVFGLGHPAVGDVQATFDAIVALDTDRVGLRRLRQSTGLDFDAVLTRVLDTEWSADAFSAALLDRKRISREMSVFFEEWDLLVTPGVASAAIPIELDYPASIAGRPGSAAGFTPFSAVANLTGQPALSLPVGLTADGRPVGLQLIGRHLADHTVLTLAALFEGILDFPALLDKSPSVPHSLSHRG